MKFPAHGIAIWQTIPSEIVTELIALSGHKFTLLDMEHGLFNPEIVSRCIQVAKSRDLLSIARLPSLDFPDVLKLIDSGIDALLFPHVEHPNQLTKIISETLLPPLGHRSYSPFVSRYSYGINSYGNHFDPSLGILIESLKAFEYIDDLVGHPSISFIYFGAYDLSVELECPGDIFNTKVLDYLSLLLKTVSKHKKILFAIYRNSKELKLSYQLGIHYPVSSVDTNLLLNELSKQVHNHSNIYLTQSE